MYTPPCARCGAADALPATGDADDDRAPWLCLACVEGLGPVIRRPNRRRRRRKPAKRLHGRAVA